MKFDIFMFVIVMLVCVVNVICILLDDLLVSHAIDLEKLDIHIYIIVAVYLILATNASTMFKGPHAHRLIICLMLTFAGSVVYSTTHQLYLYVLLTVPVCVMLLNETDLVYHHFITPLFLSSYLLGYTK